jgi:uncharacterized repeat protein (TIGR03847 family)
MTQFSNFDNVEHVTFGTVGEPGHRLFLLQVAGDGELLTVKLEKQQVSAICTYVAELLADLPSPGHPPDDHDLRSPSEPAWAVGSISVSYDDELDRMVIEVEEYTGSETEQGDVMNEPNMARVRATREQCASLIIHGTSLVEAGRPPCPLCGYPLDPAGHACPRTNGHRPPSV